MTELPGAACRLEAVCWASSGPLRLPVSSRSSRGNVLAYCAGSPRICAAPVVWVLPWVVLVRPGAVVKLTGSAWLTPGKPRTVDSTAEGWAPVRACTCQSTGTRAIARWVIREVVADRKVPIAAINATPTATPSTVARIRAGRCAISPRTQISATMPPPDPGLRARRCGSPSESGTASATAGSWVETTRPAPDRRLASSSTAITAAPLTASSCPVGSSARIRLGSPARARATATRCACPPEISSGSLSASSVRSSAPSVCAATARAWRSSWPARISGRATFSLTVSGASRLGPWKIIATRAGRNSSRSPIAGQVIVPVVGSSSPASRYSSVDLPDPEGPTRAIRSPAPTTQSVAARATVAVAPRPCVRDTPRQTASGAEALMSPAARHAA